MLRDMDRLDGELPATALAAFADDLRTRFGADEQRVDDLLAALAPLPLTIATHHRYLLPSLLKRTGRRDVRSSGEVLMAL